MLCRTALRRAIGFSTQIFLRRTTLQIHSSSVVTAKLFRDTENIYAHSVLENSMKPYQIFKPFVENDLAENTNNTMVTMPKFILTSLPSNEEIDVNEVFRQFSLLTDYCVASNTRLSADSFTDFTNLFCEVCHKFTDEQLLETLRQMKRLPLEKTVREPNYVKLWNRIDAECCCRIEKWNINQLLLVCDAWYQLNLARISQFVGDSLRKLGRKVKKMNSEQMVQSMFLCNVLRRTVYDMFDFEENLLKCLDNISLQELAVMCMGFFKTQSKIHNPQLIDKLYQRLMEDVDTVDDLTLVAILKSLRYSSKLSHVQIMMELLDQLCDQVDRLSLMSCLHIALLGCDLQCCHDKIVHLILQRFSNDIENTRLKDLERICLVIGVFNFSSESNIEQELCKKIIRILNDRIDEIVKHPQCFSRCLHYLTLKGLFNTEMISSVLSSKFLQHAYGKSKILGREIFHLDSFIKIHLPVGEYTGDELTEKQRSSMGRILTHYIPERNPKFKLNTTDRILMEVKETTDALYRNNTFQHILPHFERPDIVICYNRLKHQTIPISSGCPEHYSGQILTREKLLGDQDSPDINTIAIVVSGWNNVVRDKERYTGLFQMKLDQLTLLNHMYIVIPWHKWRALETPIDQQNYLKRQLAPVLHIQQTVDNNLTSQ